MLIADTFHALAPVGVDRSLALMAVVESWIKAVAHNGFHDPHALGAIMEENGYRLARGEMVAGRPHQLYVSTRIMAPMLVLYTVNRQTRSPLRVTPWGPMRGFKLPKAIRDRVDSFVHDLDAPNVVRFVLRGSLETVMDIWRAMPARATGIMHTGGDDDLARYEFQSARMACTMETHPDPEETGMCVLHVRHVDISFPVL